jgi:HEPN domain-containing protein
MGDRVSHSRGWFLKAESDLAAARSILKGEGPYDTACFHIQQAAEKCLKGFLAFHDQPIPHTHNLEELVLLCQAKWPELDLGRVDVTELTPFAVEMRYDFEFWPSSETAKEALDLALEVRRVILTLIPPEARP